MRRSAYPFAFAIVSLLAASAAQAQSPGAYIGLGAGKSNGSFNTTDFSLGLPTVAESQEKSSTGIKGFVGARFNKNFSAELAYVDFGKFKYKYNAGATGSADIDYKASAFTVSGLLSLPVTDDFSIFGRVGIAGTSAKASIGSTSGALGASVAGLGSSDNVSSTNLLYGAGAQYDFGKVGVRVEYENFGEVGNANDSGRVKIYLISASVLYRF